MSRAPIRHSSPIPHLTRAHPILVPSTPALSARRVTVQRACHQPAQELCHWRTDVRRLAASVRRIPHTSDPRSVGAARGLCNPLTRGTELPSTAIPVPPNCGATTSRTQAQAMDGSGQLGCGRIVPLSARKRPPSRQEIFPIGRRFFQSAGNFSYRQEIFPIGRKFFLSAGNLSYRQEICPIGRKFVLSAGNFSL